MTTHTFYQYEISGELITTTRHNFELAWCVIGLDGFIADGDVRPINVTVDDNTLEPLSKVGDYVINGTDTDGNHYKIYWSFDTEGGYELCDLSWDDEQNIVSIKRV